MSSQIADAADHGDPMIGRSIGSFRIYRLIGQGHYGIVYAAWDVPLERRVALKLIARPPGDHPSIRQAIREEAKAAANLEHENVVRIFETGEFGGWYFIAMELIEGCNLKQLMAKAGELDLVRVCQIMADVADAVGYSHRMGVLHRDLKPANLILNRAGRCKLTDFGFASQYYARESEVPGLTRAGTPAYMAPEVRAGQPASVQSDLFSLAATAWHLLTGVPPQAPADPAVEPDPAERPDLDQYRPDAPPRLVEVINRSLRFDPAERGESVEELASVLRAHTIPASSLAPGSAEAGRLLDALASQIGQPPAGPFRARLGQVTLLSALALLTGGGAVLGLYGLETYQRRVAVHTAQAAMNSTSPYEPALDFNASDWLAQPPARSLDASDHAALRGLASAEPKHGPVVQVRGQFTAARQSSTGQVSTFALVGEAGGTPLNCVVFPESYAEMSNVFGGEFGEPLVGRRVLVKGRVGLYRGEPQIVIRSVTQCVVVGQAEARSSASIDAPARTPAPPPAVGAYR